MTHRLTIDYLDDYRLIKNAFEALHQPGHYPFCLADILGYLERHPAVFALNAHLAGVNWYRHHLGELRTVGAAQTTLREAV